jgi:hypothetical protein
MENPSHSQQIVVNKKDGRVGVWNEGDGLEKKTLLNRMESITVKTSISKNINHYKMPPPTFGLIVTVHH